MTARSLAFFTTASRRTRDATRASAPLAACLVLAFGACAPGEPRVGWSILFASDVPPGDARASIVHATIRAGDCSSTDVIYAADLAYGDSAPTPPMLSRGTWAFVAEAVDASCSVIASDCVAIAVPASAGATVELLLRATDPYPLCGPTACAAGRCGLDAGGPSDAGTDDAGGGDGSAIDANTVDACASSESRCADGADDDCDGATDCADTDCQGASCGTASTCCSGACVDTTTSDAHCGGCGNVCETAARFVCTTGSCACESGWAECAAGSCVNTANNESHCGGCDRPCAPSLTCSSSTCGPASASWRTSRSFADCPSRIGMAYQYACDPNPTLSSIGTVYGTGTYTYTSAICPAAVHAGRITAAAGGLVTVRVADGVGSYTGTTSFGITSLSRASSSCSFTFDP